MSEALQRPFWRGIPIKGGDLWRLRKERSGKPHEAVCTVWTSQLGRDLQVHIDEEFWRSQVCRSMKEWLDTADTWKAAMVERGWRE